MHNSKAGSTATDANRTRTVSWDDPMIGAAAAATMSGLDYLRAIGAGDLPPPPVALLLGMDAPRVDPGHAVFTMEAGEHLYNPIGSVHGGILATLLDSALGCAVHSKLPAGVAYTTVDLTVTYLRPVTRETGRLTCEAEVVHDGRTIATARGQIVDDDGRRYATANATCLIVQHKGEVSLTRD
ncbi:MAG: PaaI family thioesterase [Actinomycetota bacterium]|nr:PaaI family thioesterase [Actinomycetota bacterium]